MATSKADMFPTDWQQQVTDALTKARSENPTKAIFGIALPESWKSELAPFVHNGEVRRLFGVRAVTFKGPVITTLDEPTKEESKAQKKAG